MVLLFYLNQKKLNPFALFYKNQIRIFANLIFQKCTEVTIAAN